VATSLEQRRVQGNGSAPGAAPLRVEPPAGRRARVPELVVGVALMVGFALAAVLWHMSSTDKQAALALARPVSRGHVIEPSDLRVVYLASDDPIAHLGRTDAATVTGRVALTDLPVGTLLTAGSVAPRVTIGADEASSAWPWSRGRSRPPSCFPGTW
jgi:flagella basal body P-ring formation protein FlgA